MSSSLLTIEFTSEMRFTSRRSKREKKALMKFKKPSRNPINSPHEKGAADQSCGRNSLVYISIAFHDEMTKKCERGKAAKNSSFVVVFLAMINSPCLQPSNCDSSTCHFAAIRDENSRLLFYALLCAMVEIYEINDSIMQISPQCVFNRNGECL